VVSRNASHGVRSVHTGTGRIAEIDPSSRRNRHLRHVSIVDVGASRWWIAERPNRHYQSLSLSKRRTPTDVWRADAERSGGEEMSGEDALEGVDPELLALGAAFESEPMPEVEEE
jgi:hypothetical protein